MPRPYIHPTTLTPTMATIIFYEKPGCINNTKQKALLAAAGHTVDARNLLTEPWTPDRLQQFFGDRPISTCFNRTAPRHQIGPGATPISPMLKRPWC
jgi:nitrogenase-associated protein